MSKARLIAIVAGIGTAGTGLWAFAAPQSFYDFATYPPYSKHFVHDAGSFLIGLGLVLLFAAYAKGVLFAALAGNAIGAWFHWISHLMDREIGGGSWRDPILVGVIAVLLTAGAAMARKEST
jgi:hypothetical protein